MTKNINDKHVRIWSIIKYITGVLFFIFLLQLLALVCVRIVAGEAEVQIRAIIQNDLEQLTKTGEDLAVLPDLVSALEDNNVEQLSTLIISEGAKRDIEQITVTNVEGVVIADSYDQSRVGGNIYLSSPEGRQLLDGQQSTMIGASSFDPKQMHMTTSRLVSAGDQIIGGIIIRKDINNRYARAIKAQFPNLNPEIFFYTKADGITADTINSHAIQPLILTYFHTTSDWISQGKSDEYLSIDGHGYFLVNNLFDQSDQSGSGMIVFIPLKTMIVVDSILSLAICLAIGLITILRQRELRKKKTFAQQAMVICVMLAMMSMVLVFRYLIEIDTTTIQRASYEIYNATMRLQPEANVFDVAAEQTIRLKVDTGGEVINTVGAVVGYNPDLIEVKEIRTDHSLCTFFAEKKIDQDQGLVTVSCGLPTPGFTGQGGTIAELVIQPKQTGQFWLRYQEDSVVLANDGLGTDVLRKVTNGSYLAEDFDTITDPANQQVIVYSASHPNSERWYRQNKVKMVWQSIPGKRYVYTFSQNPAAVPSTPISNYKVTVPASGDGEYYFNIATIDGGVLGPVSSYRVRIDTTPPENIQLKTSSNTIMAGEAVHLEFAAEDITSGVQKKYYVSVDGKIFLPTRSSVTIPFLERGQYKITVQVFDKADNSAQTSQVITVQ